MIKKKINRLLGIGCLLINLFFWPGIGTLIGGKIKVGIIQTVIFLIGFSIFFTIFGKLTVFTIFGKLIRIPQILSSIVYCGAIMMIISWIWGLFSGIRVIKVGYNPRIKNKFLIKHYIKIIILVTIILLLIGIYFYISSKSSDIEKLSIPDIWHNLIERNPFIPEIRENELNKILDQKFEQLKCLEAETIDMNYRNPYLSKVCNFDIFSHYVDTKVALGMKSELLENEKLISILNRTYNHYKSFYANKDKLSPYDNKWNHIMNSVIALDLLTEEEMEFWTIKYISFELDENQPKVPQIWNRIWMFDSLGFHNIYDLAEKYNLNLTYVNESICNYILPIDTYKKEDLFREGDKIMFFKYMSFKNFCAIPLTE